jgi:hypothetical protein
MKIILNFILIIYFTDLNIILNQTIEESYDKDLWIGGDFIKCREKVPKCFKINQLFAGVSSCTDEFIVYFKNEIGSLEKGILSWNKKNILDFICKQTQDKLVSASKIPIPIKNRQNEVSSTPYANNSKEKANINLDTFFDDPSDIVLWIFSVLTCLIGFCSAIL